MNKKCVYYKKNKNFMNFHKRINYCNKKIKNISCNKAQMIMFFKMLKKINNINNNNINNSKTVNHRKKKYNNHLININKIIPTLLQMIILSFNYKIILWIIIKKIAIIIKKYLQKVRKW